MTITDMTCEIDGCANDMSGRINGIYVCERCRIHFTSAGMGAVFFDKQWHGVRGATYAADVVDVHPGLALAL